MENGSAFLPRRVLPVALPAMFATFSDVKHHDLGRCDVRRDGYLLEIADLEQRCELRLGRQRGHGIMQEDHSVDRSRDDRRGQLEVAAVCVGGEGDCIDADLREGASCVFRRDQMQVVEEVAVRLREDAQLFFFRIVSHEAEGRSGPTPQPSGSIPERAHVRERSQTAWRPAEGRVNGA